MWNFRSPVAQAQLQPESSPLNPCKSKQNEATAASVRTPQNKLSAPWFRDRMLHGEEVGQATQVWGLFYISLSQCGRKVRAAAGPIPVSPSYGSQPGPRSRAPLGGLPRSSSDTSKTQPKLPAPDRLQRLRRPTSGKACAGEPPLPRVVAARLPSRTLES